jgi:nitroreductase
MNNLPGTFSLRNHFSSSPLFRPRSRSQAPPEVRYFFRRNHFSSCRPAEPVRLEAAREVGFARGPRHSFRGNHFFSFLPAEIGCPETPADRIAGNHCTFFEGTTFPPSFRPRLAQQESNDIGLTATDAVFSREPLSLIPLGSRTPRWPQSLSSSSFSSPSLQGGSGIPAVPRTGAWALRLLPPTS